MARYKKCPRCELNWILEEAELCEVCKAEMGKESSIALLEDEDDEEMFESKICPICKVNFLDGDEEMCPVCREEQISKKEKDDIPWDEEGAVTEVEEDAVDDTIFDDETIPLSELQDEEEGEEAEEDADENEEAAGEIDDFDESIIDFDETDIEDDEEDEEDIDSDSDDNSKKDE